LTLKNNLVLAKSRKYEFLLKVTELHDNEILAEEMRTFSKKSLLKKMKMDKNIEEWRKRQRNELN